MSGDLNRLSWDFSNYFKTALKIICFLTNWFKCWELYKPSAMYNCSNSLKEALSPVIPYTLPDYLVNFEINQKLQPEAVATVLNHVFNSVSDFE